MVIRKDCIICEQDIHRAGNRGGLKTRRRQSDVTCCKICSRVYQRVYRHFTNQRIKTEQRNGR